MPVLPIPAFQVTTAVEGLYEGDRPVPVDSLAGRGKPVVACAGIAKPSRFFDALEKLGVHPDRRITFRDHHAYTPTDIERLGSGTLITTEKDAVRLEGRTPSPLLHLRISAEIAEIDRLLELVLRACRGFEEGL
jgi:tetraacyldisaccharide 4'-kinase